MKRLVFNFTKIPFLKCLINIYHLVAEVPNGQNLFTESNLGDWLSSYVQFYSCGHFSAAEKCKLLKVNRKGNGDTISTSGEKVEIKMSFFRYLGDIFNCHGDNSDLCKERSRRAIGTRTEIISLCKEINFGNNQISNMLLIYHSVFPPGFVYNCEDWTNLTSKDYSCLENAQENVLRHGNGDT